MKTKKCIRCNADINIYASKCPYCKCSTENFGDEFPSSLNLEFHSLSLYQSTIDEITAEYEAKYGSPDRVLDTIYYAVEENHFYHRFIFYGKAKKLVFISPDKQVILPYSQICGYDIIDNSFTTGGAENATYSSFCRLKSFKMPLYTGVFRTQGTLRFENLLHLCNAHISPIV